MGFLLYDVRLRCTYPVVVSIVADDRGRSRQLVATLHLPTVGPARGR
jgi:hypothetical protein